MYTEQGGGTADAIILYTVAVITGLSMLCKIYSKRAINGTLMVLAPAGCKSMKSAITLHHLVRGTQVSHHALCLTTQNRDTTRTVGA